VARTDETKRAKSLVPISEAIRSSLRFLPGSIIIGGEWNTEFAFAWVSRATAHTALGCRTQSLPSLAVHHKLSYVPRYISILAQSYLIKPALDHRRRAQSEAQDLRTRGLPAPTVSRLGTTSPLDTLGQLAVGRCPEARSPHRQVRNCASQ